MIEMIKHGQRFSILNNIQITMEWSLSKQLTNKLDLIMK